MAFKKLGFILLVGLSFLINCKNGDNGTDNDNAIRSWVKTYGNNAAFCSDMQLANDGGLFLVGGTDIQWDPVRQGNAFLIKTDIEGDIVWQHSYGGENFDEAHGMIELPNGDLVLCGVTMSYNAQGLDVYIIKTDGEGNELWTQTFGDSLDEWIGSIHLMPDGGFMLVGNIVNPNDIIADAGAAGYGGFDGRSNIYLAKTDAAGNLQWAKVFNSPENTLTFKSLLTADGNLLILATIMHFPANDNDIQLLKVDGNGDEIWSQIFAEDKKMAYGIVETESGGFLLSGAHAPSTETNYFLNDYLFMEVDAQGNEIWNNTFGDPALSNRAMRVTEAHDGGYVATGGNNPVQILKINENGQVQWEHEYEVGGANTHNGYASILRHPEGGYLIAGTAMGTGSEIFLVRTDDH